MGSLKVSLFGVPRVERDGETLFVPRRKTLALLAYLAVTGQPHSREVLAALLWPEDDAEFARANLRRALSELRQALGDGSLFSDRSQVGFSPGFDFTTDVNTFKQHITQYRQHQHRASDACDECLSQLAEAVEMYTGDFMSGFSLPDSRSFEEWQFFEAESLRRSLAESLPALAAGYANQGDFDRAIEYARRRVAIDNLDEPAHRELMRLYALSGQQSAALRQYQECVHLLKKELGLKPDPETTALYEAIRTRQLSPGTSQKWALKETSVPASIKVLEDAVKPTRHNLPAPASPLIGRKSELQKITAVLSGESPYRWLTITGPGGVGKTRLAMEAARILAEIPDCCFQDGIWFVSLAPAMTTDALVDKIAQASNFSFPEGSDQRRQKLVQFLKPKQMLLLLDNFEHLINEENVMFLGELLAAGPGVRLLITSRARLNARSEQVLSIVGLPTPTKKLLEDETTNYESIELFRQCAVRARPDFEIQPANIQSVARICQLVQGMPLAIELAAAWLEILSPDQIENEIERSLDFLEADWHDLPERQQSLRAVFESSWSLLTESERKALLALSVFPVGFTRIAAEAVAGIQMKVLLSMAHKSWLAHSDEGYFTIHELLRQYVSEKLIASSNAFERVMENYGAYYAVYLQQQLIAMRGLGQRQAVGAVARELENIQKAWEWLINHQRLREAIPQMLPALYHFCSARSLGGVFHKMVGLAWEQLTAEGDDDIPWDLPAILLTARCSFTTLGSPVRTEWSDSYGPGDREVMRQSGEMMFQSLSRLPMGKWPSGLLQLPVHEAIQQAWSLADGPDKQLELGLWGILLAFIYGYFIDHKKGEAALRRLALRFAENDRPWEQALSLSSLGTLLDLFHTTYEAGDESVDEREHSLKAALKIFQHLGDRRESGLVLGVLGLHFARYIPMNDLFRAINTWKSAQELLREAGDRLTALTINVWIAEAYLWSCDYENGFFYLRTSIREYLELGHFAVASYVLSTISRYMARFGDLEEARQARIHSLALSRQMADRYGEAWHSWEMGDLCRLEGDLPGARQWFDQARSLFDQYEDHIGWCFSERSLGDLAAMESRYGDALRHYRESLRLADENSHAWAKAFALAGIGRAENGLGQVDSSIVHFQDAYQLGKKGGHPDMMIICLAGLASRCVITGDRDVASKLASLVILHKGAWKEPKSQAASVLQELGIESPVPVEFAGDIECGIDRLDETVARIAPFFVVSLPEEEK